MVFLQKSPAVSLEWQVAFLTLAMKPESMPQFMIISTHKGKTKILPSHFLGKKHLGFLEGERKISTKKKLSPCSK